MVELGVLDPLAPSCVVAGSSWRVSARRCLLLVVLALGILGPAGAGSRRDR
jgi:hypothetical protein